jgi:rubrerythrin
VLDAVKRRWHRDLVAHPRTHAWVLNLYRAGERHPQTVQDYFPAEAAPDPQLAALLRRHAADERRHERMYARVVQRLGEPLTDAAGQDVFNVVIRAYTPVSFAVAPEDPLDVRRLRIAHFLAHAHHLERRIARSLAYHLEACEAARADAPAAVVATVLADEERHTAYTREWVFALLPRRAAGEVLAIHRAAEARANLKFSSFQVRHFLRAYRDTAGLDRRLLYTFCAWLMEGALALG